MVFHLVHSSGTLAEHFALLFADALADSSCSSRRARLPWEVFADRMRCSLRPLATPRRHPSAFGRGWRLLALDGTVFRLTNTPPINATAKKAKSRRGRAAFAKIVAGVLWAVGLHNPLAAALGRQGESEWVVARQLLAQLPKGALLLADRLHGCAAFAWELQQACDRVGSHYLIRARRQIKARPVRRWSDGRRLGKVAVRQKGKPGVIVEWLEWREIRVTVRRSGLRSTELRLWTSLLDAEVAAALVAGQRAAVGGGEIPALRVSFVKLLELLRPLWLVMAVCADLLEDWQKEEMTKRFERLARGCVTPRRRGRSCPRAVRQPVGKWPRLLENESWTGETTFRPH